jgi:hypothetical protein
VYNVKGRKERSGREIPKAGKNNNYEVIQKMEGNIVKNFMKYQ